MKWVRRLMFICFVQGTALSGLTSCVLDDRHYEYLDSVRALEQRVERTSQWTQQPLPDVNTKGLNLEVSHRDPEEYIRCMYDLIYLAFQTDSTRFATLMLESEQSSTSEMWNYATYVLGYKGSTHDIAHKRPADAIDYELRIAK